ncbi:MAG: AAA family ATPase [Amphritea sp.]
MIYRFATYEVDTRLLEVREGGEVHAMDPLGFDLLVYLIENRDRVVTRNELLDALWPGKVVTDSALSSRLKSVRSAVGDTGSSQQVIKTIHGRGYRFIADISSASELTATDHATSNIPVGPATTTVGRDAELGKLNRWLDRAIEGQREQVFITGDAGIGKTTLTRAFLESIQEHHETLLLHGQCVNQRGSSEAYLPLLEALGRAGQNNPAVVEMLCQYAPAWLSQLPSLARLHGEDTQQLSVGVTTGRMLRELSDLLEHLALRQSVVLILEDLHWSDPSTLGWLEYFVRRSDKAHLLILCTLRPEGPHQAVYQEMVTRGHAQNLLLHPLEEAYVSEYLGHRLGNPTSPELAELTYARTEGFPLFIDTLIDHWLENGLLLKHNNCWIAAEDDDALLAGVPQSLLQLIEQQLDSLDDNERTLLETAALAGSAFASATVAAALDDSEENIESLYSHLARHGRLIRNAGETRWPDGTITAIFEFRHELYREALYDRITAARRSRLHGALGSRLEIAYRHQPGPLSGQIADHFARSQTPEKSLKYFYQAALQSFNRSASRETVAILNRALPLILSLPTNVATEQLEREMQLLLGSAYISLEGWASQNVENAYTRAQALGEKLKVKDKTPETYSIAAMYELRGRYSESQAVIEKLIDSNASLGLEAYELLACSLFHQGYFDKSKLSADKAIAQYNTQDISAIMARYGENPGVCCHGWAALDLWFLGYPDSALKRSDNALELAKGHTYSYSSALTHRTFLYQFNQQMEQTINWAEKTQQVASKQGFDFRIAQTMILEAWARGRQSYDATAQSAALARIQEGVERLAGMGAEMDLPYYLTLKADLLRHMGELEASLSTIKQAAALTPEGRYFFYEAEILRQFAVVLQQHDATAGKSVTQLLDKSLMVARRQQALMLELRTCITRCQLGDSSDSSYRHDLLNVVHRIKEGQNTTDCQHAQAIIQKTA